MTDTVRSAHAVHQPASAGCPTVPAAGGDPSILQADAPVEPGRRMDVQHPHRRVAGVAEAVLDAGRDEHERPGRRLDVLARDGERQLALEGVENVGLVLMDMPLELPPGDDLDDAEREPRRVRGAGEELHVAHAVTLARG